MRSRFDGNISWIQPAARAVATYTALHRCCTRVDTIQSEKKKMGVVIMFFLCCIFVSPESEWNHSWIQYLVGVGVRVGVGEKIVVILFILDLIPGDGI